MAHPVYAVKYINGNFFRAVAHSKKFAVEVKVPQKVGRDFEAADKAKAAGKKTKSKK